MKVEDPTGAGDSFVGGMIGYLAGRRGAPESNLRKAIIYGTVTASFCCEGFGLSCTARTTRDRIERRYQDLKRMVRF